MTESYDVIVAQADASAGYDCFSQEDWQIMNRNKLITQIGVVGSTNPGDFSIDLKVGQDKKGHFKNTTGGANKVPVREDMVSVGAFAGKSMKISAVVVAAAVANDICIRIQFKDYVRKRRATQRRNWSRKR